MEINVDRELGFADRISQKRRAIINETFDFSKSFLEKNIVQKNLGAHSIDHSTRVFGFTGLVCEGEGWDPVLPLISSLLIDLGRNINDPRSAGPLHGEVSAEISETFIDKLEISLTEKELVLNTIKEHPKLNNEVLNVNFVIKSVMDGDRLATLGPLSPMRAAATRWQLPLFIPDDLDKGYLEKDIKSVFQDIAIRQMRWFGSLWTETAKKIAKPKLEFQINYIKAVLEDVAPAYKVAKDLGIV